MNAPMTTISEKNISFLKKAEKTPQQFADFLKEEAEFRSFSHLLSQFCPEGLKEKLIDGLAEITGEEKNGIGRKVRNWLNGKNLPKNRETLFQICFILKLNEDESSTVLGMILETGIHYRNPKELAYAYALRMGMTYQKAVELKEKAVMLCKPAWNLPDTGKDAFGRVPFGYTKKLQEMFHEVAAEEEFFAFLTEHGRELGVLHETAYQKFVELLDILQNPKGKGGDGEEESFTLDQVMQEYLRMHIPTQSKRDVRNQELTPLQKLVKKCWPNEGELIRMRRRQEDVSRKALLLLYLVTEAFDMESQEEYEDYFYEDLEEDADTMLEIRWKRMDMFLDTYGMNHLDAGSPFDFLVLYALRAQGEDYASDRMEQMMEILFS